MADEHASKQREQAFLREQLADSQHKIARLRNARSSSHGCAEASSLDAALRGAKDERRLIEDLLAGTSDAALTSPLRSLIMARLRRLETGRSSTARRWRRGQPTPAAYWETSNERIILEQLLRRWHAWEAGLPYYPAAANGAGHVFTPSARRDKAPPRANPWDAATPLPLRDSGANAGEDPENLLALNEARRTALLAELAHEGIAAGHVEIIFSTDRTAIVIAYAHSEDERRAIINILLGAEYVDTLISDIRVTDPRWCPTCRARPDKPAAPPEEQPPTS